MKKPFTIDFRDGVHYLSGQIDETTDFLAVDTSNLPILLNFRDVTGINSIGIRLFLGFLKEIDAHNYQYFECPEPLVEAFNIFPMLLGVTWNPERVKSAYAPYICRACGTRTQGLLTRQQIVITNKKVAVPPKVCPTCKLNMTPEVSPADYFFFLVCPP